MYWLFLGMKLEDYIGDMYDAYLMDHPEKEESFDDAVAGKCLKTFMRNDHNSTVISDCLIFIFIQTYKIWISHLSPEEVLSNLRKQALNHVGAGFLRQIKCI